MGVCALAGISGFFTFLFFFLFISISRAFFLSFFLPFFLRLSAVGSNKFYFVKLRWLIGFWGVLFLF